MDLRITLQRRLTFCSHASQLERCVELMNMACSPEAAKRQPQETSEETSETRSRSNGGLLMHKPFERAGATSPWQTGVCCGLGPGLLAWVAGPLLGGHTHNC